MPIIDHISFSSLSMFLKCGEQFRRRYECGEIIPPSASLARGSCGHKSIEANFRQKIKTREDLPEEAVVQVFSDTWDQKSQEVVLSEEDVGTDSPVTILGRFKDTGIGMVREFHKNISPLVQPAPDGVEEKFEVIFHGDLPKLIGYMDLRTESGVVADAKFVGKTPSKDNLKTDIQMTCYHLGHQVKYGVPPTRLVKYFAISGRKPTTVILEEPARNQATLDRFLCRIEAAFKALEAGVFQPAPNDCWWCDRRWCGYWSTCRYHP